MDDSLDLLLASVTKAHIACDFSFRCPLIWDRLDKTPDLLVRHCDICDHQVHLVQTEEEFLRHREQGDCVAVPIIPQTDLPTSANSSSVHVRSLYEVVKEEIYEGVAKCQVVQFLSASGNTLSENMINTLLVQQYDSTLKRGIFKGWYRPTNVYVYLYENKDQAEAKGKDWIAKLDMPGHGNEKLTPTVTIRTEEMIQLNDGPKEKFGLSEDTRQEIYRQLHRIDDKAMAEADEAEPSKRERNWELTSQLLKKYKAELADHYGLTEDQLNEIAEEGLASPWIPE